MDKKRLQKLAGIQLNEDFSDAEHYKKKGAEKEKFEGRTIIVTDLYDGDVFGYLGHKRFVVSSPLDRGYGGVGHVDEDEVEISDVDNSLSSKEIAFLKRWTLNELNEADRSVRFKRLHELAGIQLNEYGSVTSPYSSEKYGTEENEYEELPVTSKTGYEDTFKNEDEEEKGRIFGTMTKESFKDISKSMGGAFARAVDDIRRETIESGDEWLSGVSPHEKALKMVDEQCTNELRKLEARYVTKQ